MRSLSRLALAGLVAVTSFLVVTSRPAEAHERPAIQADRKPAKGTPMPVRPRRADPAETATAPAQVSWPKAAKTLVTGKATVGGLPVAVGGAAQVETFDRATSDRLGVAGPVVRLDRTAEVEIGYASVAGARGGDFGSRLQLSLIPECALRTPEAAACRPVPLPTRNDTAADTVTADLTAAPAGQRSLLLALTATDASAQGDYSATALAPSSSWGVSPSTGGFSWNYPIRTPPVPGKLNPSIALSYSSQTVDGRTSTTNNQGSWVGEGFTYEPGYIERRYKACSQDGHKYNGDLCWGTDNAFLVLGGRSTRLIGKDKTWRPADDDGSKVEKLDAATNGDNDGEHWRITTTDGTQYTFGKQRLPGWTAGADETDSTWSVPVYGDDADEPCHKAAFADSACTQAWRWNLDHVQDVHGNVITYFYGRETNHYAKNNKTDVTGTAYHRGGWLKRVDYGQRSDTIFTVPAPARVVFGEAERCEPTSTMDCAPGKLTDSTALNWPDVPWDRNCASGAKCKANQNAPTFWTRKRLSTITPQIRVGSDWTPVERWSLDHLFTNNGDGSRTLWLNKIAHTGLIGGTQTLPVTELSGQQLPNRVDVPGDNTAALVRFRVAAIYTDTGGQIDVSYSKPDCTAGALPKAGESTKRCFPVRWHPNGEEEPVTDWFLKYVVTSVVQTDRVGGAPDQLTSYEYVGDAAWRKPAPDGLTEDKYLTWGEWRGYPQVVVRGGDGQTMTTKVEHNYLRGMDGDKLPAGGTRDVKRTDSTGVTYNDQDGLAGFEYETVTYNGDDVVTKTLTSPLLQETGSQVNSWGTDRAYRLLPQTARELIALDGGKWRETKSVTSYDSLGRETQVDDLADTSTAADDRCTRTTYADNTTTWLRDLPRELETATVNCARTPSRPADLMQHEKYYYDVTGATLDAVVAGTTAYPAPTTGNATLVRKLDNGGSFYPTARSTFDKYGRVLTVAGPDGAVSTTTTYAETAGLTTSSTTKNALGHVDTVVYEPAWGSPKYQTDPNDKRIDFTYDPMGRLTAVWQPDRSKLGGQTASLKYGYRVEKDKPVAVSTQRVRNDGSYSTEYELYDGWLRSRQTQAPGPENGRLVGETFYTPTGKTAKVNATYFAAGAPDDTLLKTADGSVDGQTKYVYDGADRLVAEVAAVSGNEKWRTLSSYHGDRVDLDPPTGGTPTSQVLNARGQLVELRQYQGAGPTGAYDATRYTYTPAGQKDSVVDSSGNTWRYAFDKRGRLTRTDDPDAGRTDYGYDSLDRQITIKDARNQSVFFAYDAVGRKTATHRGLDATGEKLAAWEYDTKAKGQLYYAARLVGGKMFATATMQMDDQYRPLLTRYIVPDSLGAELKGTYDFTTTYNRDDTLQGAGFPAAGGLPAEAVTYTYDSVERITKVTGTATTYVTDVDYAQTGEVNQVTLNAGGKKAWATYEHERGTNRLTRSRLDRETVAAVDIDQRFSYDAVGNVTAVADEPAGGKRDIQCLSYDYLRRMTHAWTTATGTAQDCPGGTEVTGVGGPAPYDHAYTYDKAGSRETETVRGTDGSVVERAYDYADAGAAQPHLLKSVTTTTPAGQAVDSYEYDERGSTKVRAVGGARQELTWDAEGNLASATVKGAGGAPDATTSYVYGADGGRIARVDPVSTTVYLGVLELRLNRTSKAVTGVRQVPLTNGLTVSQTAAASFLVMPDHHGTGQAAIGVATGDLILRKQTPFGSPRGGTAVRWPDDRTFVGGVNDPGTGLISIGAREYDPLIGRFLSADPITDAKDPQQLHGYAYSNNAPMTQTDPTGKRACIDDNCRMIHPHVPPARPAQPPTVKNKRLRGLLNDVYSAKNNNTRWVGRGKAGEALLHEKRTGLKSGVGASATFHHKDVVDLMGGLANLIDDYEKRTLKGSRGMTKLTDGEQTATLEPDEVKLAKAEAKELWDAIHATDEAGAVTADTDSKPVVKAEIEGVMENVKSKWGVRDITGEKFDESNQFKMPRHQKPPAEPKPGTGGGSPHVPRGGVGGVGRGANIVEGGAAVGAAIVYGPEAVYCAYFPEMCTFPGSDVPMA
ncbi:RHS repeat-associated core domain-containing protein [Actinoplanes sp. M2I2]|uniref:RHS repeat-associated core domain-containing protein n=1 Tax=Actinoplanes sp. M2I2 TaxID=1734444 RepID=UPI0020229014|nr:RHS repeat-associated core domain-containing protein [Actinoplanes sp. M2I2]